MYRGQGLANGGRDSSLIIDKNLCKDLKDRKKFVPDLNNQITAIACYKSPQNYVRHLKLLK